MKKSLCMIAVAAGLLLAGCVVTSVYPYYNPRDVAFDPALVGGWTNSESADEMWKFEAAGTNGYELTVVSKSETNVMDACRFKLSGSIFLDLFTSEEIRGVQPPPIPAHFLVRLWETNSALRMAALDYEWLAQTLTNQPAALRHYFVNGRGNASDGRLVLTADTAELQKFITKNLNTKEAWKDPFELKRAGTAR